MGYYVTKNGEKVSRIFDDYVEVQQYRSTLVAMSPEEEDVEFEVERE